MKKVVKKNLRDLVAASYATHTHNDSPYANLRHKLSPRKLEEFINSLTENEKEDYLAYCESPSDKREQREHEAHESQAARERSIIRKNRIFDERFSRLRLKAEKTQELKKRLDQAKSLSLNEIAEALVIFPELLPSGHKAPALTLARKHMKAILLDNEKEYLMYVWADTSIPIEVCYSNVGSHSALKDGIDFSH